MIVEGEDQPPELPRDVHSLPCHILEKVSGCGDQRTTPRIRAVKVCPQTKEKDYETTLMEFK